MPEAKVQLNVRVAPKGRTWVEDTAWEMRISQGELIACALVLAAQKPDDLKQIVESRRKKGA